MSSLSCIIITSAWASQRREDEPQNCAIWPVPLFLRRRVQCPVIAFWHVFAVSPLVSEASISVSLLNTGS
ncbi:hypothetical protein AcW2_006492 [Taiwanofungus camphoratus]|nr:hypothetical protein AcW2_006492 [Antrodia cinnamomea]